MKICTRGQTYRDMVGGDECSQEATRFFRLLDTRLCYAACPDHSKDIAPHYREIDQGEYDDIQDSVRAQPIAR
jgi:hypothetical protein